ncbi:MAG TPA: aminotransferase class V-fold PLP-dependent enzyme [Steroidobacteraceae bacterium]|nr:aminotransferase class V-fold PLP-dependent enzyme [Steroidobacteraceae bacterium]
MAKVVHDGSGYFLYHSIGMFPGKDARIAEALSRIATLWGTPDDAQWPQSLEIRQQFLARWTHLIGAPAGTLTAAANVTTALYSVIGALPDRYLRGRKLLIAADCFPSLHFLLSGMAERRGFVVDTVPMRPGEHWVRDEDFIARWNADVGVALVTWVTSTASHRCDLRALVAHGRSVGSLVGVDITQGVGIVPFDAQTADADFVVASTLKWLCGVAGAGVLHVRDDLLRECRPELRGWFSQENPFAWALDSFEYARDARRFDHGTPSILACAACLPALEWHAQQDFAELQRHNRRLVEALLEGCEDSGLELVSPAKAEQRGGSVMFRLPAHSDPSAWIDGLREEHVFADCRGRTLRLSPGNVTSMEGVRRLLRALQKKTSSPPHHRRIP